MEDLGILITPGENEENFQSAVKSSQTIDLKRELVRNVVTVGVALPFRQRLVRGSITVDVKFKANNTDLRRVDVKFESCRLKIFGSPLDLFLPLGPVGPTGTSFEIQILLSSHNFTNIHLGWLRTVYIDEDLRITRGHKGSVFILARTAKKNR